MLCIFVWNIATGIYEAHLFPHPFLPILDEPGEKESYWFPSWGPNPFVLSEGLFDPEWN
jgi:hypothetical protein